MNPTIVYFICMTFGILFGPKALAMGETPERDHPITWGLLVASVVIAAIPVVGIIFSIILIWVWFERLTLYGFLGKPIFPLFKKKGDK